MEQICDRVVIIDRGKLVRAGRLSEMLGAGDHVEIVVDQLPPEVERAVRDRGAAVEKGPHGPRIRVEVARKREMAETLWNAGCDVISMNPIKGTLEEVFLKTVDGKGAA